MMSRDDHTRAYQSRHLKPGVAVHSRQAHQYSLSQAPLNQPQPQGAQLRSCIEGGHERQALGHRPMQTLDLRSVLSSQSQVMES